MKAIRVVCFLSFLFLIACGNRQSGQPAATATPQQSAGQPATPAPTAAGQPASPVADTSTPDVTGEPVPPGGTQPPAPSGGTPPAPAADNQPAAPSAIWIPAGTVFRVRLEKTLDTRRNRPGDRFTASLVRGIMENGAITIPSGTHCYGHLVQSKPSGRFRGHALLSLSLDSFDLNGQRYDIRTLHVGRRSGGHKKRNWVLIGGGSGVGTMIGAVAGGPAGALIGAGAGGAVGTASAAITGKKNIRLPVETVLRFQLRAPVSVAG